MDGKWEIRRVSTSERILDKIRLELAQPVGIILFGADCDFKNEVMREVLGSFGSELVYDFHNKVTIGRAKEVFDSPKSFMVVFDSQESLSWSDRHQCVMNLKSLGAASVVGIYVKVGLTDWWRYRSQMSSEEVEKWTTYDKVVTALSNDPPTADGLDYLVVVEDRG